MSLTTVQDVTNGLALEGIKQAELPYQVSRTIRNTFLIPDGKGFPRFLRDSRRQYSAQTRRVLRCACRSQIRDAPAYEPPGPRQRGSHRWKRPTALLHGRRPPAVNDGEVANDVVMAEGAGTLRFERRLYYAAKLTSQVAQNVLLAALFVIAGTSSACRHRP